MMKKQKTRTSRLLSFLFSLCLLSFTGVVQAADWYVSTTGSNAIGDGSSANPWQTIQFAVSKAAAGDVIHIGSGSFAEQLNIGKNLTLVGEGVSQTTIASPASLAGNFNSSGSTIHALVYIHDADNVIVRNLTVNGNGFVANGRTFAGIAYRNAGGLVDGISVNSLNATAPYTSAFGFGIFAVATNGIGRTLAITNSSFPAFQQNAIGAYGKDLTATIDGNTITGAGPLLQTPQYGIELASDATGTITNNQISSLVYEGPDGGSAFGILVSENRTPVTIKGNTLLNVHTAIFVIYGDGTITQNRITYQPAAMGNADYWWGILVNHGHFTVTENELEGGGNGTAIDAFSYANENTYLVATNNIIKNFETGISTEVDEEPGCSTGEIHCNSITGTLEVIFNNQEHDQFCPIPNAGCNWFGSPTEADFKASIIGKFNYGPWLTSGVDTDPGKIGFQPTSGTSCACFNLFLKSKKDVLCYGEDDGTVKLTINGGSAPFSYTLDGGEANTIITTPEFTVEDLGAGEHTITVTDNTGYSQSVTFTISGPATPVEASATATQDITCFGAADGSSTINATGGVPGYTVVKQGEATAYALPYTYTGLTPGEHTFEVTDASGCKDVVTVEIGEPTKLEVDASEPTDACNGSNGSVVITASGGTAPYSGTGEKTGLAPGNHTFTVTDAKGCTATITVTIGGTGAGAFNVIPEHFPGQFNTGFSRSLYNRSYTGSQGGWSFNSNENATLVVTKPYYQPSSSYALKIVNFKTYNCGSGWSKAVSPKINLTGPCCPTGVKLNFTLWTYNVVKYDTKAKLEIDFSKDGGSTWTEVWSKTSGDLYTLYGDEGKGQVSIAIPVAFQTNQFRYRIRGEMAAGDYNNFYLFIDDINITSPAACAPLGAIGDYVWHDKNGNGRQDSGEPGIANVTVKLTLPNGTTQTKTTSSAGAYLFTGLEAGTYTVNFTTPTGFVPTTSNAGGVDDALDSDPVAGNVTVVLGAGQTNRTIDAGFNNDVCTNTVNHKETFPNKFNSYIKTSLYNQQFTGSTGTWTVNSNSRATVAVLAPYYSPSSSYALKVVNLNTNGCGAGWSKAVSPKVDLSQPCCPSELKMSFTLWTYKVVKYDSKAKLEIDFSADGGNTWTEVWSKTSAQLYTSYGANGKTTIEIPVPVAYQKTAFRYRIRGEMASGDCYNFYVFLDDIKIASPARCTTTTTPPPPVDCYDIWSWLYTYFTSSHYKMMGDENTAGKEMKDPGAEMTMTKEVVKEVVDFRVVVFPNPSASDFELQVTSKESAPATIRVMDMLGRVVKTMRTAANSSVRFGEEFRSGSYVVEIVQGDRKETIKLVKL